VGLSEASARKIIFTYEILKAGNRTLMATGHTVHVPTNRRAEVCSLPQDLLSRIKAAGKL